MPYFLRNLIIVNLKMKPLNLITMASLTANLLIASYGISDMGRLHYPITHSTGATGNSVALRQTPWAFSRIFIKEVPTKWLKAFSAVSGKALRRPSSATKFVEYLIKRFPIMDINNPIFQNEDSARHYLEAVRWPKTVRVRATIRRKPRKCNK